MMDTRIILIANPGSTSLKFKLFRFPDEEILATGKLERIKSASSPYHFVIGEREISGELPVPDYARGVEFILDSLIGEGRPIKAAAELSAVGFKAVHGGLLGCGPGAVFLSDKVIGEMRKFATAAPVHNAAYLEAIECFRKVAPDVPLCALFEPAFHSTITEEKYVCGVPFTWREKYGIRRYGFHGASHRYIGWRAPDVMGWDDAMRKRGRLVSCHLGGSSSLCAIRDGKSVDTTMEFSPQSGIIHSTRCETIDPFIILFAEKELGLSADDVIRILCYESGLLGISGVSGDLRDLQKAADSGNTRARLALEVFHHQVRRQIAAMAASLNGIDALVFTGGIGENAAKVRSAICAGLGFLGVELNEEKNRGAKRVEARISSANLPVDIWVIPTNEEIIVARDVYALISRTE